MKKWICVLLLLSLLCALCGCSLLSPSPDIPTDGLASGDGTQKPTQSDTEQAFSMTYFASRTLNPYTCTDFTNRALFSLLYQGLFSTDRSYTTQPVLCSTFSVASGGKIYTFYLEDATFSDGTPVTGEDVVASYAAAKASAYYSGRFIHIKSVTLADDGGVKLTLDTEFSYDSLALLLDIPIVKADQVKEDRPLGTGPYFLDESLSGLRLRRRADWWCSQVTLPFNAPVISLQEAQTDVEKENAKIRDNFQYGDLDLVFTNPLSDLYAEYLCDKEVWSSESGMFLYIGCNKDSKVFTSGALRAALTYAIDRDALLPEFHGFAQSATLPASPSFPHYSKSLAEKYRYDPEKWAAAVKAAGKEDASIVLLVNSADSLRTRIAQAIAENLRAGGLQVTVTQLTGSAYTSAIKYRRFDLYVGMTKLSPNMDLTAFFSTYGALSYGGINNVAAYTLSLEALANYGNYYTLHRTVMENGLLCPVLFGSNAIFATRGVVSGLTPARDNLFYYSTGRTLESAKTDS